MKASVTKKNNDINPNQFTLFGYLFGEQASTLEEMSSDDWLSVIGAAQSKYQVKKDEEETEQAKAKAEEEKRSQEEEQRRIDEHRVEIKRRKDEIVAKITSMDLPLDWNNHYSGDERTAGIHAESISDGLVLSQINLGVVDIEYISLVSGYSYKEVIETLKGSIYQNPERWDKCFYKGWETADEYLSGNLMRKHKIAKEANDNFNGYFSDNINAIESVLPEPIPVGEIYVTLGSPWVPPDIIDDFIEHLLGETEIQTGTRVRRGEPQYESARKLWPVEYEPVTGIWDIPEKNRYEWWGRNVKSTRTYGTERMPALHIIEKTLNMKTLQIFDKVSSPATKSGEKRVLNKDETVAVQEKQQKIIKEFQEWIWKDERRKERLEMIYENNFSCVRQRLFDGGFLTMPGLSPTVKLYPYQKNAVARILFTPNTLLAHDVGAGKTYIMVAAGMELRRIGISRKNVYVVPNNIVGQWESIFHQMYPQANLMVVEPKSFAAGNRQNILMTIRDKDFDAVIIAYSCFELIPLSKEYYKRKIEEEIAAIERALEQKRGNSRLYKKKEKLGKELSDIRAAIWQNAPIFYFDDLRINTLFVDEAHNFKNIPINTKIDKVLGINKTGSAKCSKMLDKIRCVQRSNDGRGIVFATGTPITNSVTDMFVMQTYLQYGELRFLDLNHFDNWAATFGEKVTEFEIDVDTNDYRLATRFSKFHNLPELTNLLAQFADFHKNDKENDLPDFDGYDDKLVSKTPKLETYLKDISLRAEMIRHGRVRRTVDNMLKLTTDGRKAALDIRLATPQTAFSYNSKVFRCMENVLNIYLETAEQRLTQLVFCDISTPKAGFNLYNDLKSLLVRHGAKERDIAFIHEHDTEKRRTQLFKKMQDGEVRVLLGSTFKLGLGVNVQRKLVAVHHLDVPWRPADMIQREGRILRQGNENKKVRIFRYITDGSFDAYSWQLLESKQRFICQLLSGSVTERNAADVDDVVLNYAEIKALTIGNPLIKERVETANELKRACALQRKFAESQIAMKRELFKLPGKIANTEALIEKALLDIERYEAGRIDIKEMEGHRQYGTTILEALNEHAMQPKQKTLLSYQGFVIVLPENMLQEKPYVWIEGSGRYYTETGDSDIGCISRIDNKLNSLPKYVEEQRQELRNLTERKADLETELRKDPPYAADIAGLREKLAQIDKSLGVDKE